MIPLPQLQIRQQPARIGIESQLGQYEIKRGYAELDIESSPAVIIIDQEPAELTIDSSRFWEALNGGNGVTFTNRIYSQMPQIIQQNILRIVERGNRIADLQHPGNPVADIMYEDAFGEKPRIQYFGPASSDNIDIRIIPHKPETQFQRGELNIEVNIHKPEIEYKRGNVNIYMKQYPLVTITSPMLDSRV